MTASPRPPAAARQRPSTVWRYGIAVLLALSAFAVTYAAAPVLSRTIFIIAFAAVGIAAWYGGFGSGVVTATISLALVNYFLIEPVGGWIPADRYDVVRFALFFLIAAALSASSAQLRTARERAERSAAENEELASQLQDQAAELEQQMDESQALNEQLEQTARQLGDSRRELESVLSTVTDTLIAYDTEWRFRYLNPTAQTQARQTGRDPEALIGKVVWDEFPELRGTRFEVEAQRAVRTNQPVEYEEHNPMLDRTFAVRVYPSADGVTTVAHDITERHRVDQARRASEHRYRALVEASTGKVWRLDARGMVDDIPWWRELTGQTLEEIRGEGWALAIHPEDRDRVLRSWGDAYAGRATFESEYRVRLRDGSYRWYRGRVVPVLDDEGELREWIGSLDDIHEERQRQLDERQEAQTSETLYRVGRTLASELDRERIIQIVTDAATRLTDAQLGAFSYTVTDERGDGVTLYAVSGVPTEVLASLPMPRHTPVFGPAFRGEGVMRSDDVTLDPRYRQNPPFHGMLGGQPPIRSYLAVPVLSRTGATLGGLFFGHPAPSRFAEQHERIAQGIASWAAIAIENAQLFEAERTARAEAEHANRVKSDFLATMSHELRTPLNAIGGFADLLLLGVRGPVTEAQREDLERIKRSQRHLLSLINDVLNVSKLEAGRVEFLREEVSLEDVAAGVGAMLEPQIRERELVFTVEAGGEPVAHADVEKVRQIVLNLMSNAIKFTPPGGRVTIRCAAADDDVMLEVEDNGRGIPPEQIDRIFEPFVQLDRSLSSSHEGTGLGLSICRDLARGMGGDVTVRSEVGVGSTFTLLLPNAAAVVASGGTARKV